MSAPTARILFASVHPPGRAPSQRFRYEQYVDYLADNGLETTFAPLLRSDDYPVVYGPGRVAGKAAIAARTSARRVADLLRVRRYDIVFVQREAVQLGSALFERLAGRSAKLVFDFDDAIWLPNASEANERLAWLKRPQKTEAIVAASDLIFAGNAYLAHYASRFNRNVEIVPTTIDTDRYVPHVAPASKPDVCIGWTGSMTTIPHFERIVPVLRRLTARFGERVGFKVIGDPDFSVPDLGIQGHAWKADTEVADLEGIDIGIMPLPDDEWAKGKCGLKGLQYMALAKPTVMSPVGVNETIIDHGRNGFLASSDDEWFATLSELIEDPQLRGRLGAKARDTVVESYSVRSQQGRYLELLSGLL